MRSVCGLDNPEDTVIPVDVQDVTGNGSTEQAPEEITIEEESSEEAVQPRVSPDPGQPTLQQLE